MIWSALLPWRFALLAIAGRTHTCSNRLSPSKISLVGVGYRSQLQDHGTHGAMDVLGHSRRIWLGCVWDVIKPSEMGSEIFYTPRFMTPGDVLIFPPGPGYCVWVVPDRAFVVEELDRNGGDCPRPRVFTSIHDTHNRRATCHVLQHNSSRVC